MLARLFRRRLPAPTIPAEPYAEALGAILSASWTVRPNRSLDHGGDVLLSARMPGLGSVRLDSEDFEARVAERWPALTAAQVASLRVLLESFGGHELHLRSLEPEVPGKFVHRAWG